MSEAKNILLYGGNQNVREGRIDFPINAMFTFLERHTVFDSKLVEEVFWERVELLYQMKPKSKLDLAAMQKQFDEMLESETPESLTEWLNEQRSKIP